MSDTSQALGTAPVAELPAELPPELSSGLPAEMSGELPVELSGGWPADPWSEEDWSIWPEEAEEVAAELSTAVAAGVSGLASELSADFKTEAGLVETGLAEAGPLGPGMVATGLVEPRAVSERASQQATEVTDQPAALPITEQAAVPTHQQASEAFSPSQATATHTEAVTAMSQGTPSASPDLSSELLNELLSHLRTQISSWVEAERRTGRDPSTENQKEYATEVISHWLADSAEVRLATGQALLSEADEHHLSETALSYTFGAGPWERYLSDPNISDIHINGHDTVWLVDRQGRKMRGEPVATSDAELIQQIRWAGASLGRTSRRFDVSSPVLNMRLPNGSRLHAIMDVSMVPMVTIRMHDPNLVSLSQLGEGGMFDEVMENFLRAAVRSRHNIVICGGMGTGKTTLCRALLNEIPPEDRIVTVEDELELGIHQFHDKHPDVGVLEARPANLEGAGEFTLESLLRECLRMHADRIVVGEVRGNEVLSMLLAMTSGQDGSLCTIHANSTKEAFERLAMYASMTSQHYSQAFTYRLVGSAVNFVIHVGRGGGQRFITSIREVVGSTESHVQSNEIWKPGPDGRAVLAGEPLQVEPTLRRLEEVGFDRELFNRELYSRNMSDREILGQDMVHDLAYESPTQGFATQGLAAQELDDEVWEMP